MSAFKQKVYEIVRNIPKGRVVSYGQVALMAGLPRAAIQVGWVLHISNEKDKLPWWRVINNAGRISTTCLEHTAQVQKEILESEGVIVNPKLKIDIEKYRFIPNVRFLNKMKLPQDYIHKLIEKYSI